MSNFGATDVYNVCKAERGGVKDRLNNVKKTAIFLIYGFPNSDLNLYSNYIISYHVRNCPDMDSIAVLVFVDIFKVQITTLILSEVEPWAVIVSAIGSIMIS